MRTGQICIKTPSGMLCAASPITSCGCGPDPKFKDPYPPIDPNIDLDQPDELLRELRSAFAASGIVLAGKGAAVLTTVKLMLLGEVPAAEAFVVTGLDGMAAHHEKAAGVRK